jgi:hypothetical protein
MNDTDVLVQELLEVAIVATFVHAGDVAVGYNISKTIGRI